MTIIDGIGDEVTYFFIAVVVVLIGTVAWITTDIQQSLYVRTVYVLEDSRFRARVLSTLTNHTESATIAEGVATDGAEGDESAETDDEDAVIEEIVETMDAPADEASDLRRRRLARFASSDAPATTTAITIKLKYIDDRLQHVDASLDELLGDFKRRHFDVELASNKLVRLIFNGQVLKRDQATLESYGMFDNCVVHCLVHQARAPVRADHRVVRTEAGGGGARDPPHRDWDLGNLLVAALSFTLASAWYFRFQHPQLFTIWTTIGLIGLTSGFVVIALVRYFPEVLTRDPVIVVQ